MYPYAFVHMLRNLVHYGPTTNAKKYWRVVYYLSTICTNFLPSSTIWNLVLPYRIQKHYSFSTDIPATQICLLYFTCSGTLHKSCTASTALHTGKLLLHVVMLVMLQGLLNMLHLNWDPHVLFWAIRLPSEEVLSIMWTSLVMLD